LLDEQKLLILTTS